MPSDLQVYWLLSWLQKIPVHLKVEGQALMKIMKNKQTKKTKNGISFFEVLEIDGQDQLPPT